LKRILIYLGLLFALSACAESIIAPAEDIAAARHVHGGPSSITLITVVNNKTGGGAHTGLLINGSERVVWDPAGTWWSPNAPERNDLHYGMTDRLVDVYVDYHTRESFNTILQEVPVSTEIANQAIREAANYGAVPKATCALSTTQILSRLQGFESIPSTYFPAKIMGAFAALPNVKTREVIDDDPDDNSALLPQT